MEDNQKNTTPRDGRERPHLGDMTEDFRTSEQPLNTPNMQEKIDLALKIHSYYPNLEYIKFFKQYRKLMI